jgi:hypothetical protein
LKRQMAKGCCVSVAAIDLDVVARLSDTPVMVPGSGRSVLFPAGHQIEKLPFDGVSRPLTGYQPTAAEAGSDAERPLRPMTCQWAVAWNDCCTLIPDFAPLTT